MLASFTKLPLGVVCSKSDLTVDNSPNSSPGFVTENPIRGNLEGHHFLSGTWPLLKLTHTVSWDSAGQSGIYFSGVRQACV